MKGSRLNSALALLACLAPAPARAEPVMLEKPAREVSVGGFVGGDLLGRENELGNSFFPDQVPGPSLLLGGRGGLVLLEPLQGTEPAPRLGVEVEATLAFASTDAAENRDAFFAPVLGWRAHLIVDAWAHRRLTPFAVAGIGGETVFSGSPFLASGDTDAATHWGLGARWRLGHEPDRSALRIDLRHRMSAGRDDLIASAFEIHIGFAIPFGVGGGPRIGKQVIADRPPDPPPDRPDDRPAPAPPLPDADGDGIADAADRCRDVAEVKNGVDDGDGCPETDEDEDKVVGSADRCPDDPEDLDGHADDDGCPDLDNEGDGVADLIDGCPDTAETANGFADSDGCPDELPADLKEVTGEMAGVAFDRRAGLRNGSRTALERVRATLVRYPDVRVRVTVHVADGSLSGLELAHLRATAVKQWLVKKGIEKERIETTGQHGHGVKARAELDLIVPAAPPQT